MTSPKLTRPQIEALKTLCHGNWHLGLNGNVGNSLSLKKLVEHKLATPPNIDVPLPAKDYWRITDRGRAALTAIEAEILAHD